MKRKFNEFRDSDELLKLESNPDRMSLAGPVVASEFTALEAADLILMTNNFSH